MGRVFVGDDDKIWDIDSGDPSKTLCIYLMPLDCELENGQNDKYYVTYILQQ